MLRRYPSADRWRHPVISWAHRDRSSPETGARARGWSGVEAGRVHAFCNLSPKSQDKYLLPQSQPVQKISSGRIGGQGRPCPALWPSSGGPNPRPLCCDRALGGRLARGLPGGAGHARVCGRPRPRLKPGPGFTGRGGALATGRDLKKKAAGVGGGSREGAGGEYEAAVQWSTDDFPAGSVTIKSQEGTLGRESVQTAGQGAPRRVTGCSQILLGTVELLPQGSKACLFRRTFPGLRTRPQSELMQLAGREEGGWVFFPSLSVSAGTTPRASWIYEGFVALGPLYSQWLDLAQLWSLTGNQVWRRVVVSHLPACREGPKLIWGSRELLLESRPASEHTGGS